MEVERGAREAGAREPRATPHISHYTFSQKDLYFFQYKCASKTQVPRTCSSQVGIPRSSPPRGHRRNELSLLIAAHDIRPMPRARPYLKRRHAFSVARRRDRGVVEGALRVDRVAQAHRGVGGEREMRERRADHRLGVVRAAPQSDAVDLLEHDVQQVDEARGERERLDAAREAAEGRVAHRREDELRGCGGDVQNGGDRREGGHVVVPLGDELRQPLGGGVPPQLRP